MMLREAAALRHMTRNLFNKYRESTVGGPPFNDVFKTEHPEAHALLDEWESMTFDWMEYTLHYQFESYPNSRLYISLMTTNCECPEPYTDITVNLQDMMIRSENIIINGDANAEVGLLIRHGLVSPNMVERLDYNMYQGKNGLQVYRMII